MGANIAMSRKLTIQDDEKGKCITLAHLRALVNLAEAAGLPDDALVVTPSAVNGMPQLSVREGDA
jgi:hypothetical protein